MNRIATLLLLVCSVLYYGSFALASSESEMEYVRICNPQNDCKRFSRLIMGTDHLIQGNWSGDGQPELPTEKVREILDEAVRLGINFFDTSPIYVGGVEYQLGKWMHSRQEVITRDAFYYNADLNPDRSLYTVSKGGFPFDLFYSNRLESGSHSPELTEALKAQGSRVPPGTYASRLYGSKDQITNRISEELGHSQANLGSFLTIYLMHRDDGDFINFNSVPRNQTPVQTIMEALSAEDLSKNFWMIGWSNWATDRINESTEIAAKHPELSKPAFNSAYFSLFEMSTRTIHAGGVQVTHEEMNNPDFQKGIKENPYSPLGGFSILDKPEPRWENAKKAAKEKYDQGDAYWKNVYHSIFTEANQARYDRVVKFTKQFNMTHNTSYTLDQMINAYALAHKRTDFLTIGPVSIEQLRRTVGSLKLSRFLSDADLDFLHHGRIPWKTL